MKQTILAVFSSNTVLWSIAEVIVGIGLAFAANRGYIAADWSGYGWTLVSAGLLIGAGRSVQGASQPFDGLNKTNGGSSSEPPTNKGKA
jgi:hypothetical protein